MLAASVICMCGQFKSKPKIQKITDWLYESCEEPLDKPLELNTKAAWDSLEKKHGRRNARNPT